METESRVLKELVSQIVEVAHPLRIILFGSGARGEMRTESDLDLLVVVPEGTHRRKTAQQLYCTIRGVDVPFDLVVATPSDLQTNRDNPGLIYGKVLDEGKTIYAA